jgi:hypothetical protein
MLISDKKAMDRYLNIYNEIKNIDQEENKIIECDKEIKILEKKKDKLLELSLDGFISNEDFHKRNTALCESINVLEDNVAKLKKYITSKKTSSPLELSKMIEGWYK